MARDLYEAKNDAILTIVRLWGVNDDVKMTFIRKILDAKTLTQVNVLLTDVECISDASAQQQTEVIEKHCPSCGRFLEIESEDYVNPCSSAACRSDVVSYHLGCGSQYRDYCVHCGAMVYDSAREQIESAEWKDVEYRCSWCTPDVQPGHFACGNTYRVPV